MKVELRLIILASSTSWGGEPRVGVVMVALGLLRPAMLWQTRLKE